MHPPHISALLPYEHAMFGTEAWSEHGYRLELADHRWRHYVVALDPELVGWAGVVLLGDAAEILTVGVIPAARRRGIAGLLLDDLETHVRAGGAREMFLEVRVDNAPAVALYERRGYVRVGTRRGYYANGTVDAAVMRRELHQDDPEQGDALHDGGRHDGGRHDGGRHDGGGHDGGGHDGGGHDDPGPLRSAT